MKDKPVGLVDGVTVTLRLGRAFTFHALSWATMKRTRKARALIYDRAADVKSEAWEDAVIEVLHASATEGGEQLTIEELAEYLTPGYIAQCFRAMNEATGMEVAKDGEVHPTKSLNGTSSMPSLSLVQDGAGPTATN